MGRPPLLHEFRQSVLFATRVPRVKTAKELDVRAFPLRMSNDDVGEQQHHRCVRQVVFGHPDMNRRPVAEAVIGRPQDEYVEHQACGKTRTLANLVYLVRFLFVELEQNAIVRKPEIRASAGIAP